MKDVYPQSMVWPYVLAASFLFGTALGPKPKWSEWFPFADIQRQVVADKKEPRAARRPLIILHDPFAATEVKSSGETTQAAIRKQLKAAADPVPDDLFAPFADLFPPELDEASSAEIEQPVYEPIKPTNDRLSKSPTSVAAPPVMATVELNRLPNHGAEAAVVQPPVARTPSRSQLHADESVTVWKPPPGWIPRPIQALSDEPSVKAADANPPARATPATPERVRDSRPTNETGPPRLVLVESQPAVASSRVISGRDRRPLEVEPQLDSTAIEDPTSGESLAESKPELPNPDPQPQLPSREKADGPRVVIDLVPTERIQLAEPAELQSTDNARPVVVGESDLWPSPSGMNGLLESAFADPVLDRWALAIRDQIKRLVGTQITGASDQLDALKSLRQLANFKVDKSRWPQAHRKLHGQLQHAVRRRVDVWTPLMNVARVEPSSGLAMYRAWRSLGRYSASLNDRLLADARSSAWSEWLELASLIEPGVPREATAGRAEHVLGKLRSDDLTLAQREFLRHPSFIRLETELRNVIARSLRPADLIRALEAYEQTPDREHATAIIGLLARWRSAPDSSIYLPTINAIVAHYRNANMRLSVSEDLINRFVPAFHQYADEVNDTILGAAVRGNNSTQTNLSVAIIPDPHSIRLGLMANGNVRSSTTSRKGPVRMFNRSDSSFAAGKQLIVRPDGIRLSATELRAETGNRMLGMQTDWDNYPIIGWLVRNMAMQQHAEQRPRLRKEILQRVKRSASQKFDTEVAERVIRVEQRIDERLVGPLRQLDLDPQAMEMRTTQDRAIVRTRLASGWQFGSHTPRPEALVDSKMSVQVHQTAANNWIEQLQIQGRRSTLGELFAAISERFDTQLSVPDEKYADTIVEFAPHHPFEFEFDDGQVMVTLHIRRA